MTALTSFSRLSDLRLTNTRSLSACELVREVNVLDASPTTGDVARAAGLLIQE